MGLKSITETADRLGMKQQQLSRELQKHHHMPRHVQPDGTTLLEPAEIADYRRRAIRTRKHHGMPEPAPAAAGKISLENWVVSLVTVEDARKLAPASLKNLREDFTDTDWTSLAGFMGYSVAMHTNDEVEALPAEAMVEEYGEILARLPEDRLCHALAAAALHWVARRFLGEKWWLRLDPPQSKPSPIWTAKDLKPLPHRKGR